MLSVEDAGYVRINDDDPDFTFDAGLQRCSRAALEIRSACPTEVRDMLLLAITEGWLRPIAYMPKREHTWLKLEAGNAC